MKKVSRYQQVLIIPDTHAPYHDKKAWDLVNIVAEYFQPTHCKILGDFIDNYSLSPFTKDPSRLLRFADELDIANAMLRRLEQHIGPERDFVNGNHEHWLPRYIEKNAPELKEIMDKQDLLGLKSHKWRVHKYRTPILLKKIYIVHDDGRSGANSTRQTMQAYQDNIIIGHNHRMDYHVQTNSKGIAHIGASFGWLGDKKYAEYTTNRIKAREWVLGFGWGTVDNCSNIVYVAPIPIIKYTCLVNGKVFGLKGVLNG